MRALLAAVACAAAAGALDVPDYDAISAKAQEVQEFVQTIRRALHKHPELMYQEVKTSETIQQTLESLGVRYTTGWAKNTRMDRIPGAGATGVVAEIGSGQPPCVALRADIDALPIYEKMEFDFKSQEEGKMHACGHDGHTSMLLGAAKVLKSMESTISELGTVRLIFQPAEEGGAGGARMSEEGALRQFPPAQRIFGMHVWPQLPSGVVGGRAGALMAATDSFEIVISGVGGHAAMPHLSIDPIVAGSAIVQALQAIVSRETSPLSAAVISVTQFNGGFAHNVIPDGVTLGGTMRSLTLDGLSYLRNRTVEVVETVAAAHRCNVSMTFMADPYPPTVNHPDVWQFVKRVAGVASANKTVVEVLPTMGGEDFGFLAAEVPGAFLFLGQGSGAEEDGLDTTYGLHNPRFTLHERVLHKGVALHTHLALQALLDLQGPDTTTISEVIAS